MKFRSSVLILGDLGIGFFSLYVGLAIRFGINSVHMEMASRHWSQVIVFVIALLISSWLADGYLPQKASGFKYLLKPACFTWCFAFFMLSVLYYITPSLTIGRGLLAISLTIFVIFQTIWQSIFRFLFQLHLTDRVLILGTGEGARMVGDLIENGLPHNGHSLVGYISCSLNGKTVVPKEKIVGQESALKEIVIREKISKIIVAVSATEEVLIFNNILLICKLKGIEIIDLRSFYEEMTGKLMLNQMDLKYLICSAGFPHNKFLRVIKRIGDIVIAIAGLIITIPIWPLIAVLVKIDSSGPVFYRQVRVGYMERNFTLYKFRTMRQDAESTTGAIWTQENDCRLRPIGKFLRRSRLDELPQLYNVVKGEMSFVGPRPERPEFVEQLNLLLPFYAKRHFIKPGITGWAQIKYPYGASVEDSYEKLCYDLYYFKMFSIWMDILIILTTFKVMLLSRGAR